MKKKNGAWGTIVGIISFIIGVAIVRAVPAVGTVLIIALLVGLFARWYGNWYLRKEVGSESWLKFLFWSNVATWLLPPVGFFTSIATYTINSENHGEDRETYMTLAIVGIVLSLINSFIGAAYLIH
jgi:hypothetical protein